MKRLRYLGLKIKFWRCTQRGYPCGSEGNGGANPDEPKKIYDSAKKAPEYPDGFEGVKNGTKKITVKNEGLLEQLRKIEPGEWKKVYQNGYVNGEEASIHYFQHTKTGKVFNVKVYWEWSTGWN